MVAGHKQLIASNEDKISDKSLVLINTFQFLFIIRPFQFEQLTVLNFDGSPIVCSINRGLKNKQI